MPDTLRSDTLGRTGMAGFTAGEEALDLTHAAARVTATGMVPCRPPRHDGVDAFAEWIASRSQAAA